MLVQLVRSLTTNQEVLVSIPGLVEGWRCLNDLLSSHRPWTGTSGRWHSLRNVILGRFPFVRSARSKRTGSGQFKWRDQGVRVHFPATTLQFSAPWSTGVGELSGSDSWAGPFWPEPVLRTCAFRLRLIGPTGQTGQIESDLRTHILLEKNGVVPMLWCWTNGMCYPCL